MEENENEGLAGEIRKLKKALLDTQQKGFDVLAEAAITLPKDGIIELLEKQSSEYLNLLMHKIGLDKEYYETCQLIKEILDVRSPDYDEQHAPPSPSDVKIEHRENGIFLTQSIPVEGATWTVETDGLMNWVRLTCTSNPDQSNAVEFESWDAAIEHYEDVNMKVALAVAMGDIAVTLANIY